MALRRPVVLIAPDKFRGSLTAAEAAEAIAAGVLEALPQAEVIIRPVADGGEGMVAALVRHGAQSKPLPGRDPFGLMVHGEMAVLHRVAYVESAQFCGLGGMAPSITTARDATSFGLGVAIWNAADQGVGRVVVGLGGSATTDGGSGALRALGFSMFDRFGASVGLGSLERVWTVRRSEGDGSHFALPLILAADVDSPLVGPDGAARVFGGQKGADGPLTDLLERRMVAWGEALERSFGVAAATIRGGGAAGGIAVGLHAAFGAPILSGATLILDATDVAGAMAKADLVITGEGSLDHQSLRGKLPVRIALMSKERGLPVWAFVGRSEPGLDTPFDMIAQVTTDARADQHSFHDAASILTAMARRRTSSWWNSRA